MLGAVRERAGPKRSRSSSSNRCPALSPAPSPGSHSSPLVLHVGPGKGASWKWWKKRQYLFFSYCESEIWTKERLRSRTEGGLKS